MPRRKASRRLTRQPKSQLVAPLIAIEQKSIENELARYQRWRKALSIKERFAELLWSPEGMRFTTPHAPDESAWLHRKLAWQKKYGDGHMKQRARLQRDALESCRKKIFTSLRRMEERAGNSSRDWAIKLKDLEGSCNVKWEAVQHQICAIGEHFRDRYWLDMHSREVRRQIREEYRVRVETHASLPSLNGHLRFVRDHLGAVAGSDLQAYVQSLERVVELWAKIRPELELFRVLLPDDASYRGKDGKPWPPIEACVYELKALVPKLSPKIRQKLLTAWCLRPFPKMSA